MAADLQQTLSRVMHKCNVLVEKYQDLQARHNESERLIEEHRARIEQLQQQLERLTRENEYLRMARHIGSTPEAAAQGRKLLSKMVRDIDKCIAQLNA